MLTIINLCLIVSTFYTSSKCDGFSPKDVNLSFKVLMEKYGYTLEEHKVVTSDGYILTIHRVPHGKSDTKPNGKPILFIPGLGGSSENIFSLGPGRGLGFLLSERNFDVWALNLRGSMYSRKHLHINPDDGGFWQFSLDEGAMIDTPETIDYILNITNKEQLSLIGHSLGSTIIFALTSGRPEYNEKVKVQVHLAPAMFFYFINAKLTNMLTKYIPMLTELADFFKVNEIVTPYFHEFNKMMVSQNDMKDVVLELMLELGGTKSNLVEKNTLQYLVRTSPSGMSIKQMLHYLQCIKFGMFRKYDFGIEENLLKYNSTSPPIYDIRKSTPAAILVHLKFDWLSSIPHTELLKKYLPNIVHVKLVEEQFNHFDLVTASNAREVIYDYLLDVLDQFTD